MTKPKVTILCVEDDDVDFWALERAFEEKEINVSLLRASTPEVASLILKGTDSGNAISKPYIILLDINLPVYNGIDFLRELRKDPELKTAIVFALSTSSNPKDIQEAYELNVAGYFLKETNDEAFNTVLSFIEPYLNCVQFPNQNTEDR